MTALSQFLDGVLVHQGDLNNLSANIDALTQLTTGKNAASGVSSKPMAMVHLVAPVNVNSNVDAAVAWAARDYDTDNLWTPSVADHFVVQTPGKYVIRAGTAWTQAAGGTRTSKVFINGTANTNMVAGWSGPGAPSSSTYYTVTTPPVSLATGATVYLDVWQDSGSTQQLVTTLGGTWFSIEWVAPF
jgi:hypothetical protein